MQAKENLIQTSYMQNGYTHFFPVLFPPCKHTFPSIPSTHNSLHFLPIQFPCPLGIIRIPQGRISKPTPIFQINPIFAQNIFALLFVIRRIMCPVQVCCQSKITELDMPIWVEEKILKEKKS